MKQSIFTIVNAVGCLLMLGIVISQWGQNETKRRDYLALQKKHHDEQQGRLEAERRAESFETDLAELKRALEATQKAAEEAANAGKAQADLMATATSERDKASAERDALLGQIKTWEEAIKLRDGKLAEQNATIKALREKLDEAIAKLKKAGAR